MKISDRSSAGSSGKLRIGVRQGGNSCETTRATFPACKQGREYITQNEGLFASCKETLFKPTEKLEIRVLSDSGDDNYIDEAGVLIGGEWRNFYVYSVKVNKHGEGSSWRTVID